MEENYEKKAQMIKELEEREQFAIKNRKQYMMEKRNKEIQFQNIIKQQVSIIYFYK